VTAVVAESRASGAAGLLVVDASGLCLAADGQLLEGAGGQLSTLAAAARRVHPDAPRPPVVALETDRAVCLVTSAGGITSALLKDK